MTTKQIVFTKKNTAELIDHELPAMNEYSVKVKTAFSTVSCGTERANITANPNVSITGDPVSEDNYFPRFLGYSSSGIVEEVGTAVTSIKPGDRVAMFGSFHAAYNILHESRVVKLDDRNDLNSAAMSYITTFPMAAIRKTRLEIGESALIMGLGTLGQFAVQIAHAAGAVPVIAVDPVAERRAFALKFGADYALDPTEPDFAETVKKITNGGVNVAVEVTGVGKGLDQALDCMAKFGRVALLGCTRDQNFTIDYYRKVHGPGITMIGAHTLARPEFESRPGFFTHQDDIAAMLRLMAMGRVDLKQMIGEIHSPSDCGEVYTRLINDKNFPIVVQFDWSKIQ